MVWGFIWRFVFYGFVFAAGSTFLVGFFFKLFGGDLDGLSSTVLTLGDDANIAAHVEPLSVNFGWLHAFRHK